MGFLVPLLLLVGATNALQPTGLLCDYQKSPALGVRAEPRFTWIVPACSDGSTDHQQSAYQLKVSVAGPAAKLIWDSGKVSDTDSTYVAYSGPKLAQGTEYHWIVTTWTTPLKGGSSCQSDASGAAKFVTGTVCNSVYCPCSLN